jgi:hypothetical protein
MLIVSQSPEIPGVQRWRNGLIKIRIWAGSLAVIFATVILVARY